MHAPDPETQPDEATLAQRVGAAGPAPDREAEAELCRRLAPRVRLYGLRHLGEEAAAADLMQQVMILMIERLRAGALREPERLASFVFGICRMTVLDLRRGHARRERLLETYGEALWPPEAPPPDVDHVRLAHCLERLPDRERTVLMLTFYDDMPADALARELDLSPANVRVIRHRGLERLRACVTGEST
ncbi:MAG TPA: sigma-70 family RNA polymerase sigma factor [Gammaproteobacteria bacterium]